MKCALSYKVIIRIKSRTTIMSSQSDRITLHIPFIMNHHDKRTIAEVFNNHGFGQVDRVDFNLHKKFPDTAYSAFVHFFPYENEKMIDLVDELSQNRNVRFDLNPASDPVFGKSEYWVLMKSTHTIPDTPKNIHQVMNHVVNLENTIQTLTETITSLSARITYLEDPAWLDDNELDSPLTMEDLATTHNQSNTHIRFPDSDADDSVSIASSLTTNLYTPRNETDCVERSLQMELEDEETLSLGSVTNDIEEGEVEEEAPQYYDMNMGDFGAIRFTRVNSNKDFDHASCATDCDDSVNTPLSLPDLIPIDAEHSEMDDDAMSIETHSSYEDDDNYNMASIYPSYTQLPSPHPEEEHMEQELNDTSLSIPAVGAPSARSDWLEDLDKDTDWDNIVYETTDETGILYPEWGGSKEDIANYAYY